jgi:pyruvate, water dikinase
VRWAALIDATDAQRFGGKAASLARAIRAGLPVPPGLALADAFVTAIGEGDRTAAAELANLPLPGGRELAVRSSAVGEDSASASFAGQHASELGVLPGERLLQAVRAVWRSGFCDGALGYRDRLGLDRSPSMGVVIQPLIDARLAGVLFTRNPISGAPERVIEASWGLGESVVQGRVIPDRYRLSSDGTLIELIMGEKRTEARPLPGGGVADHSVAADLVGTPCLDEAKLRALHELTLRCEAIWHGDHDLEWAFAQNGKLHLLQRRPVTTSSPRSGKTWLHDDTVSGTEVRGGGKRVGR